MVFRFGVNNWGYSFEMVDRTDEVSSKHGFEVVDKEKLMWFEEVFEECKKILVS
ncbi:N-ethylammeline chlorohydrolase [Streptococcus pneumoniae]|nr:N-ethylammeline chlorohydrolase [Streptococcus pneumoniae]